MLNCFIQLQTIQPVIGTQQPVNHAVDISKQATDTLYSNPVIEGKTLPFYTTYKHGQWVHFQEVSKQFYSKEFNNRSVFLDTSQTTLQTPDINQVKPYLPGINTGFLNIILAMLLTSIIILSWIKIAFTKYVTQIFGAIFNYHDSYKLFRDHNSLVGRVYFLLNIIFALSVSIFMYQAFRHFGIHFRIKSSILLLAVCFGLILCYYLFRLITTNFYSYLFRMQNVFSEYLHNSLIFYKVTGLFILPLSAITAFAGESIKIVLVYIGISIVAILYIINVLRGTRIMLQKGVLLYYWILYLCTLEILPFLLAYKFIIRFA